MKKAACQNKSPKLFFPERGQSTRPAKKICAKCPVSCECADYANRTQTEYGIWGGEIQS